jgi:hypothetical protein
MEEGRALGFPFPQMSPHEFLSFVLHWLRGWPALYLYLVEPLPYVEVLDHY